MTVPVSNAGNFTFSTMLSPVMPCNSLSRECAQTVTGRIGLSLIFPLMLSQTFNMPMNWTWTALSGVCGLFYHHTFLMAGMRLGSCASQLAKQVGHLKWFSSPPNPEATLNAAKQQTRGGLNSSGLTKYFLKEAAAREVQSNQTVVKEHRATVTKTLTDLTKSSGIILLSLPAFASYQTITRYLDKNIFAEKIFHTTADNAAQICETLAGASPFKQSSFFNAVLGMGYQTLSIGFQWLTPLMLVLQTKQFIPTQTAWDKASFASTNLAALAFMEALPPEMTKGLGELAQSFGIMSSYNSASAGKYLLMIPLLITTIGKSIQATREEKALPTKIVKTLTVVSQAATFGALSTLMAWTTRMLYDPVHTGWKVLGDMSETNLSCAMLNQMPVPITSAPETIG
jgi:hypothetical protein